MKRVASVFLLLWSWLAGAEPFLRPPFTDAVAINRYMAELGQEYPWLPGAMTRYNGQYPGAGFATIISRESNLILGLHFNPAFDSLLAQRGEMVTIHVGTIGRRQVSKKSLRQDDVARVRQEIASVLESLNPEQDITASLETQFKELVARVARREPKALVTGILNGLPHAERQALFKRTPDMSLLQELRNHPLLTDQSVAQFHFNAYELPETTNKSQLLDVLEESLRLENRLIAVTRALWFVRKSFGKAVAENRPVTIPNALSRLELSGEERFDLAEGSEAEVSQFFDSLSDENHERYLKRLGKLLVEQGHEVRERSEEYVNPVIRVVEVPPKVSVFRGSIGGDCSTDRSFGFVYSPLERVFFVYRGEEKTPVGYIAATIVLAQNEKTLYVHDVTGSHMSTDDAEYALHGLSQSLGAFGVSQMTVSTPEVAKANNHFPALINVIGKYAAKTGSIQQFYSDQAIRTLITGYEGTGTDTYDKPAANRVGHPFVPDIHLAQRLRSIATTDSTAQLAQIQEVTNPKERLLQAIDLVIAGLTPPEDVRAKAESIAAIMKNDTHRNLSDFYTQLGQAFEGTGIEVSNKFVKEHYTQLWQGHFKAPDALNCADPTLLQRTHKMAAFAIRRVNSPTQVENLIASHPDFFIQSEEFQNMLRGLDPSRAVEANIMRRMLQLRIPFDFLAQDRERLHGFLVSRDLDLVEMGIRVVLNTNDTTGIDTPVLVRAAELLDNEDAPTEGPSLAAVELLVRVRTTDHRVLDSLKLSVDDEDNVQIAYRAALALLLNGKNSKPARDLIFENRENQELSTDLRALGRRVRGESLRAKSARTNCANQVANAADDDED